MQQRLALLPEDDSPHLPAETRAAFEQAADRAKHARARNTVRAYKADLADFEAFCERLALPYSATAPIVATYLDQLARMGAKVATIQRRLAAINSSLRGQGLPALSVREEPLASVMRAIRRDIGAPPERARPLELDALRAIVATCDDSTAGMRDKALLLFGFAGAFRRSEIAGLDWAPFESERATDENPRGATGYVAEVEEGLRVVFHRSKTNQTGDWEEVAICRGAYAVTCPVRALEAWRAALGAKAGQTTGPVFRAVDRHGNPSAERIDGGSIARIVKRSVARAAEAEGASADEIVQAVVRMSGHSLRSGLVTTAFAAGLTSEDVMRQTRHRNINTLLSYRRHATAFVGNVTGRIGL